MLGHAILYRHRRVLLPDTAIRYLNSVQVGSHTQYSIPLPLLCIYRVSKEFHSARSLVANNAHKPVFEVESAGPCSLCSMTGNIMDLATDAKQIVRNVVSLEVSLAELKLTLTHHVLWAEIDGD